MFTRFILWPWFMPVQVFSMEWFEINDPFFVKKAEDFSVYTIEHDIFESITRGDTRQIRLGDVPPHVGESVVFQSKTKNIAVIVEVIKVSKGNNLGSRPVYIVDFEY